MKVSNPHWSAVLVLIIVASLNTVRAQSTSQFVGTYRIDIPGKVSTNTTRERIDRQTVQRTDTTTIGKGARGAGTLEIKADGTYVLRDYIGYEKVKTGKWIVNDEGAFSDKGGIELLEVKSGDYGKDQRSWYIFINHDGEVEAREAPYTTYNSLRLTKASGSPITKSTSNPAPVSAKPATNNPPKKRELTQEEIYKLQRDIAAYLMGKTQSEVESVLSAAKARHDPDGYSQEFSLENVELPIENFGARYKIVTLQFDAPPSRGGKVKNVNVR